MPSIYPSLSLDCPPKKADYWNMALCVLLADESPNILKAFQICLEDYSASITSVYSGEMALNQLQIEIPDIIFADILLPKKNGYQISHAVKTNPHLAHIPVVLLCNNFMSFAEDKLRGCRANGTLIKPFHKESLCSIIDELLIKKQKTPQINPAAKQEPEKKMLTPPQIPSLSGWTKRELQNDVLSASTQNYQEIQKIVENTNAELIETTLEGILREELDKFTQRSQKHLENEVKKVIVELTERLVPALAKEIIEEKLEEVLKEKESMETV